MGEGFKIRSRWQAIVVGAISLILISHGGGCGSDSSQRKNMERIQTMNKEIDHYANGGDFTGSIDIFLEDGKLTQEAFESMSRSLRSNDEHLREQIARALVMIGRKTDPLYKDGGMIIRDDRVISLLIDFGLAIHGVARDYSQDALLAFVPPMILIDHGQPITENLKRWPGETAFLLVAKTKHPTAVSVIEELARREEWRDDESCKIAMAALGDKAIEGAFVDSFLSENDPAAKASLAKILGYIGTETCLKALAGQMRTDLIVEVGNVILRSVRVDIVAALSFNLPEEPLLFDSAVRDETGYDRIEEFCVERFGTKFDKPRPPFLWIQGLPHVGE